MKKILLCLLVVAMLMLSACGAEQAASSGEALPEETTTPTDAAVDTEAAAATATDVAEAEDESAVADAGWDDTGLSAGGLVFMAPATDEALAPYDDFDVFNYNEGVRPLLFYTRQDIPNFRLVSVTMDNDGGDLTFAPDEILYQRNWLNPERPSLIQILPIGDINSGFGVTFTDPEDPQTEHFYLLSPTGRGEPGDPELIFTEIY